MIGLGFVYLVAGATFAAFAVLCALDRRASNAAFYALIALSFLAGDRIGDIGNGVLVLALVAIAGFSRMRRGDPVPDEPRPRGNALFLPALIVPVTALAGTLILPRLGGIVDPKQVTLVSLALGVLIALAVCHLWLRPRAAAPLAEGVRLMDGIGWAAVLPQMLASLGAVFALAGVGDVVGGIIGQAIPQGSLIGAVAAYGLGMALFTMVMGNAFAAFPVMTAAIGVPLLIHAHHGNPAIVAALGMLAGFCGTLMTPMAANFNIVPAALLGRRCPAAARLQHPVPLRDAGPMILLDAPRAGAFARLTLGHLGQEYPHKLDHVLTGPADAATPAALHPIFHGSFDWHSCVHGWWQMLRLLRLFPAMPEAAAIRARADAMLSAEKVAGELAYLARPASAGFERPYGWAWLLALHGEAALSPIASTPSCRNRPIRSASAPIITAPSP